MYISDPQPNIGHAEHIQESGRFDETHYQAVGDWCIGSQPKCTRCRGLLLRLVGFRSGSTKAISV